MPSSKEDNLIQPRIQPEGGWYQRSLFHISGNGWINDPCAPGFDPKTGIYHLFYQWNPKGCDWGNMSWGHVTSKNLVTWSEHAQEPVLAPDQPYDKEGVFTGCFHPTGPHGESDQLTLIYSSVCSIPFHWTKPYPKNPAGISLATSIDGGKTWMKNSKNPILAGEPLDGKVTGFRDPFVSPWPALDSLLGVENGLYGMVAGGYSDRGPTAWLYRLDKNDLESWKYLGPLMDIPKPPLNDSQGKIGDIDRWTGHLGHNWECGMFMSLESEDGKIERHILITGLEGMPERRHLLEYPRPASLPDRSTGSCIWLCGSLKLNSDNGIKMSNDFGGILDHGCFYAANSFKDPLSGKRVVIGWIREEDISLDRCRAKGWTGNLSLPRELYVQVISDVGPMALKTNIEEVGNVEVVNHADGSKSIVTLGIRPLSKVSEELPHVGIKEYRKLLLLGRSEGTTRGYCLPFPETVSLQSFKLTAHITLLEPQVISRLGFHIKSSRKETNRTTIAFSPNTEELVIDRAISNNEADIAKHSEIAAHTLFRHSMAKKDGGVLEQLVVEIWVDGNVIEVFANERTAISSMIYADPQHRDIVAFVELENGATAPFAHVADFVVFESVEIVAGLGSDSLY